MHAIEIAGEWPADHFIKLLKQHGLLRCTGPNIPALLPSQLDADDDIHAMTRVFSETLQTDTADRLWALWHSLRGELPDPLCLIAVRLRVGAMPLNVVMMTTAKGITSCLHNLEGWRHAPAAYHDHGAHFDAPLTDSPALQGLTLAVSALVWMLHCRRHQAVEFAPGDSRATQRFNAARHQRFANIMKPRVVDLTKARVERPPVDVPPPSSPTGVVMPPHDHPGVWREYRHPRFRNKQGTRAWVKPYAVHGGATQPRVSVFKVPAQ